MTLVKYKKKRKFNKTPEPKGKIKSKKTLKLLYVIQKHAASHLHYDFRLQLDNVLLSWAVPKGPCLDPGVKRLAMHVEDHPVEYGSFEGIIPKGQYGGGTVMLWDQGEWIPEDDNLSKAYHQGNMKFRLKGKKLKGLWKLIRINNDDKTWLLIKAKDEYSQNIKKYDITVKKPKSVLSQRTLDEITKKHNIFSISIKPKKMPKKFSPQLATLVDKPPSGKNWLHEVKFDGYRIIAIKYQGKTRLVTRNNNDWTNKFINIKKAIDHLPVRNLILDGEVVVLDEQQKSNFQALQNSIKDYKNHVFYYYIFDLPYFDKYNLTSLPLIDRKKYLKTMLNSSSDILRYSDHIIGSGTKVFKNACKLFLEGIISKEITSPYLQTRTKTWLKSKCIKRQEFVIGGYTKPHGSRINFGALLLGSYNKQGGLIYNGNVGTGFSSASLQSIYKLLKKYSSKKNPFSSKSPKMNEITWVKPNLVAEIEFTEWTKDGYLRHPSFQGLRLDKKAKNVVKEIAMPIENSVDTSSSKLTNPDKILYREDKFTKQDIAQYYEDIQKWILPFVTNRPLTLLRCPEGYKKCFYQKHITDSTPSSLYGISIKEKEGKSECIYIKDTAGLMALAQLGVLEIHPWGSRIESVEYPDIIIFDLDPSPEVPWRKVVNAAKDIKKHLIKLKLKSYVKTTGGKGLHVVIPIKPEYNWQDVKKFCKTFVDFLVLNKPNEYVNTLSKTQRRGKIFIDYLRNQRGATAVAPYSTRARLHAPVSTPLDWNELTTNFKDTFFTIRTLPKRLKELKKLPWKDFYKIKQSLNLKKYK